VGGEETLKQEGKGREGGIRAGGNFSPRRLGASLEKRERRKKGGGQQSEIEDDRQGKARQKGQKNKTDVRVVRNALKATGYDGKGDSE